MSQPTNVYPEDWLPDQSYTDGQKTFTVAETKTTRNLTQVRTTDGDTFTIGRVSAHAHWEAK
jgi:hypothetical protein